MDANTKFDIFNDQISQFINSHVPRRKLSKREIKLSTLPWITKPIRTNGGIARVLGILLMNSCDT